MRLTLNDRRQNARDHALVIAELLERPTVKEVPQRIYRARLWMELGPGDIITDADVQYLVVTLVQNLNVPSAPNQPMPKLQCFVTRAFTESVGPASVARLDLFGQYSVDEIVAFLRLDTVTREEVEWVDDTKYSTIVVVGHTLRNSHNG